MVADVAPAVLEADHCAITLTTETDGELEIAAASFPNARDLIGQRLTARGYSCEQPLLDGWELHLVGGCPAGRLAQEGGSQSDRDA